jgi:hypothetical protein
VSDRDTHTARAHAAHRERTNGSAGHHTVPANVPQLLSSTHNPLLIVCATIISLPTSRFYSTFPMTTSNQTTDPSSSATEFIAIFHAASKEYRNLTGQGLETHPFAVALEDYVSPSSVLNVFRKQARAFDAFRKGEDKLMASLTSIVYILFSVSETLGKGISLVSILSMIQYIGPSLSALLALLSLNDTLHCHRCSSRGESTSTFLDLHSRNSQIRK